MQWFRFYHEFVDDPKIAMMTDSDQLLWVKALCLASANEKKRGTIELSDEEICWKLRITVESWRHAVDKFRAKGMLDHTEEGYRITNWDKRQFRSDSSAERVAKHRAQKSSKKRKKKTAGVTETAESQPCNVTVTPPEQIRSDQNRSDQNRTEQSRTEQSRADACPDTTQSKSESGERENEPECAHSQDREDGDRSDPADPCDRLLEDLIQHPEGAVPAALRRNWHMKGSIPWRDRLRQVDENFALYVGKQISFSGDRDPQHPKRKGDRYIERLENETSGVRSLIGYWRDFVARQTERAVSAPAPTQTGVDSSSAADSDWVKKYYEQRGIQAW